MSKILLNSTQATFEIILHNESYFIELPKEINDLLYNEFLIQKLIECPMDTFHENVSFMKHFSYYREFLPSSYLFSKLKDNKFISEELKKTIKDYIIENMNTIIKESLPTLIEENSIINKYIDITFSIDDGIDFHQIHRSASIGFDLKNYNCNEDTIYLNAFELSYNYIIENQSNTKIHWNFNYPINILQKISYDDSEFILDFINKKSNNNFESTNEFFFLNFKIHKGNINKKLKHLKELFMDNIQIMDMDSKNHSEELLIVLDLRKSNVLNYEEIIQNTIHKAI